MDGRWEELARRELSSRRGKSGAWGYHQDGVPGIEPTTLSVLGLIASGSSLSSADDLKTSREAANWLTSIQRADGSLPACANPAMPGWATPYAILLWGVLGGYEVQRGRACRWLLGLEGRATEASVAARAVVGHDPTLIGWPWVAETNSWVEPTALAILALHREGLGDHPRVGHGVSLILDRAIPGGGWNYGNRIVFGRTLRPQPGPTGLALLALAALGESSPIITAAIDYLSQALTNLRAPISLGWGLLAPCAYDACPAATGAWLEEAFRRSTGRRDATLGLALLLLAAHEETLDLLVGSSRRRGREMRR